jgi:hypothetical protein
MIQSKGLSLHYWVEAINCENYIVNHTPTKALKNITLEEAWTTIKLDVSHFHVFGSLAWAHIFYEKRKALHPKVRSSFLLDILKIKRIVTSSTSFNEIIIIIDVKFDENLLAYEPNSTFVPSLACKPSSTFVPYFVPILVYSLDDNSEDENPPLPAHLPPNESIEHELTLAPLLPICVCSNREASGDLFNDPRDQHHTHSQFQQASSLSAHVLETHYLHTFTEARGHPN